MNKPIVDDEALIASFLAQPDMENHIWVTKFGHRVPVREMTTKHIHNCISAFHEGRIPPNYLGGHEKWNDIFTQELTNRQ